MTAPDVLDLRGVADTLGVRYGRAQTGWRHWPGFPPPFVGGRKGESPRWSRAAVLAYRDEGRRFAAAEPAPIATSAARPVANDIIAEPRPPALAALLAAAGG